MRRPRICRRCKRDYEPSRPLQKVCDECRTECSSCGTKLTEDNWDTTGRESGKQFRCRACVANSVRNSPNRKEWQKDYDLRRNYNITLEEFEEMSLGGCSICNSKENLVVDHCHTSGKVRGVLCSICNVGLGMFKDNVDCLRKAYVYLSEKC